MWVASEGKSLGRRVNTCRNALPKSKWVQTKKRPENTLFRSLKTFEKAILKRGGDRNYIMELTVLK